MKTAIQQIESKAREKFSVVLIGTLAGVVFATACSKSSKPAAAIAAPSVKIRRASLDLSRKSASPKVAKVAQNDPAVKSAPKPVTYRGRNYGVSFTYPWQYAYSSARTIAVSDSALLPKSDGTDGQTTLARVDVPKGFYPDTDFDSGSFILSVNQDMSQTECEASVGQVATLDTINGAEFRWAETGSGGKGAAITRRNYVSYANDTCYEVELAVKTKYEEGIVREINPDQVMSRLDSILKTVEIVNETPAGAVKLQSSAEVKPELK